MKNFRYKKKYGQNFLINKQVIDKIVRSISPESEDMIVEIGPGNGAITKYLVKHKSKYIGIEIDKETENYLSKYDNSNTHFIYDDFLNVDLENILKKYKYDNLYIVGNLPYYITTPIIDKIIDYNFSNLSLVIMVQKEVGERFVATPHTRKYGYYTVLLNYFFEIQKVADVDKMSFYPIPKVDSVVLKLTSKSTQKINPKLKLFLKDLFKYKRKNLRNNLKNYNLDRLENILKDYNMDLNSRAEDLSLDIILELYKNI